MNVSPRQWLGEKHCSLCGQTLGSASSPYKRFYCLHCRHAICQECNQPGLPLSEKSRKGMCRRCAGPRLAKRIQPIHYSEPNEDMESVPTVRFESEVMGDLKEEDTGKERISALREAINEAHWLLEDISAYEKSENSHQFQSQQAALKSLKSQEKWYEVQMLRRDAEIKDMHRHLLVLSNLNCDLQWKVQSMEKKVIRPRAHLTQSSWGCCGNSTCVLF